MTTGFGLEWLRKPFNRDEWLITFDRRIWFFGGYLIAQFIACLSLSLWWPTAGAALFHTFWQGESSYLTWRYLGYDLHPLKEYFLIVLGTGTIQLTAFWYTVFKNGASLLDLPTPQRIFNPNRFPGFYGLVLRTGRLGLFAAGLCPEVWPVAFLVQRHRPLKFGVLTVLLGNATKLAGWALVCHFTLPAVVWKWWVVVPAVILVVVLLHIFSRLVERFLPRRSPFLQSETAPSGL